MSACISKSGLTREKEGARKGRRCANLTIPMGTATSLFSVFPRRSYRKERLESRQKEKEVGGEERRSLAAAMTYPKEQCTGELWQQLQALAGRAHEAQWEQPP